MIDLNKFDVDNFGLNPSFLPFINNYPNLQSPPLPDLFFQDDVDVHANTTRGTVVENNLHQTKVMFSLEFKPISTPNAIAAISGKDS